MSELRINIRRDTAVRKVSLWMRFFSFCRRKIDQNILPFLPVCILHRCHISLSCYKRFLLDYRSECFFHVSTRKVPEFWSIPRFEHFFHCHSSVCNKKVAKAGAGDKISYSHIAFRSVKVRLDCQKSVYWITIAASNTRSVISLLDNFQALNKRNP